MRSLTRWRGMSILTKSAWTKRTIGIRHQKVEMHIAQYSKVGKNVNKQEIGSRLHAFIPSK